MNMPHSLEIRWIDRVAAEGGGTRLTVKVDGRSIINEQVFLAGDLEQTRKLAIGYLEKAKFENLPSGPAINV
jgi:hypothetical protein